MIGRVAAWWYGNRGAVLAGCIGAGFVVAPEPVWAMLFYLLVLPFQARATLWPAGQGRLPAVMLLMIATIFWFVLTLAWDVPARSHPGLYPLWLWNGFCTLLFVLGYGASFGDNPPARDRLISILIAGGSVNCLIALARLPWLGDVWAQQVLRMPGWAEARHPILGAAIIGFVALLALGRMLAGRRVVLHGLAVALCLIFIVLTGSRGPLLAVLGAAVILVGFARLRLLAAMAGIVALIAGAVWLLHPPAVIDLVAHQIARGDSHRLDIIRVSLQAIARSPWIGLGPNATLGRPGEDFPHNLFLSAVFYGGVIGLGLMLALFGFAVVAAWRAPSRLARAVGLALIAQVVLVGMTDLSNIIKGPSPMWYLFWLPLLLSLDGSWRSRPS